MPKHIALRIASDSTAAAIDARAAELGIPRNEWITRVIEWALEHPVQEITRSVTERI